MQAISLGITIRILSIATSYFFNILVVVKISKSLLSNLKNKKKNVISKFWKRYFKICSRVVLREFVY